MVQFKQPVITLQVYWMKMVTKYQKKYLLMADIYKIYLGNIPLRMIHKKQTSIQDIQKSNY